MNIQQLRYIVAIDRFRNFARAADACNISQPTLSAMLVKLEDELDVRIFDRTNKVVKPTSVGAGSVLGDLIKSGVVPSTKLDFIFRQDTTGLIVTNAHHVNAGEPLEIRQGDTDFYFMRCEDPGMCVKRAIEFMTTRIPRKFGMDPLQDVQVLVPMRKNVLGTDNLNVELQKALNPHGDAIIRGGTMFRIRILICWTVSCA